MLRIHWLSMLVATPLMLVATPLTVRTPPTHTYYVKNGGNNGADGLSDANAWSDFTNVNSMTLNQGDTILLKRGSTWNQQLTLHGTGTSTSRITVQDYGTATDPPTIDRSHGARRCIRAIDTDYWTIRNLKLKSATEGIYFDGSLGHFNYGFEVHDCVFYDMDADPDDCSGMFFVGTGWDDVAITGCVFNAVTIGVQFSPGNLCTGLVIDDCESFGGLGPGFALQNCSGTISNFNVHDVGGYWDRGTCGGLIVSCEDLTITDCSFSGVSHGGGNDGCGFDFEAANVDCTMSRCMLFNNEGPGIQMFSGGGAGNTGTHIDDCLLYNNNLVPHNGPDPGSDANFSAAIPSGGTPSTGRVRHCGSYINASSTGHFSQDWEGFDISYQVSGTYCDGWIPVWAEFYEISVGGNGYICGTSTAGVVTWNGDYFGNCWNTLAGAMNRVSIGNDGDLWGVNTSGYASHYSSGWSSTGQLASKVSVGSASNVWCIDSGGGARYWSGSAWVSAGLSMLQDIDAGASSGEAWAVDGIWSYARASSSWNPASSSLVQISVRNASIIAGYDVGYAAIVRTTDGGSNWSTLPGTVIQVSEGSDGVIWGVDGERHVWRLP